MKNQPAEEEHAEHTSVDDLEQIVIEAPQQLAFSDSQLETESTEDEKEEGSENTFVKPEQLINISGLYSPSTSEPADIEKLEDKFKGFWLDLTIYLMYLFLPLLPLNYQQKKIFQLHGKTHK